MIEIEAVRDELMARANVVGVGIGYKTTNGQIVHDGDGNPIECIVVSVTEKVPAARLAAEDLVPPMLDGEPTDVIETGVITIVSDRGSGSAAAVDPRQRIRPITPGLSIGLNPGVTAGTLGFIVERAGTSDRFLLSNWHVIAADNTPIEDRAVLTITQPGNADGGRSPADVVAQLADFVPISSGGLPIPDPSDCPVAKAVAAVSNGVARITGTDTRLVAVIEQATEHENRVDAALGRIDVPYDRTTPVIGVVSRTATATLGTEVQKFGRTTSHTVGTVTQVGATFTVQGYPGGPATFVDQLAITPDSGSFLEGGDSGSGLADMSGAAVGLCFAGSPAIGIANTWQNVEAALGVTPARS